MKNARPLFIFVIVLGVLAMSTMGEDLEAKYSEIVGDIVNTSLSNSKGWERLLYMADTFGIRLSGTVGLSEMIDWSVATMNDDDVFGDVGTEPVNVTVWVRSQIEKLVLNTDTMPAMTIGVTALGGSIATLGPDGQSIVSIQADVIVLDSWEDADEYGPAGQLRGKIVVWNQPWTGYSSTSQYRRNGAAVAGQYGAVASLTRSVTPFSLYTLHTGSMSYQPGTTPIPAGAITVEDALLFKRMQDRGTKFSLTLTLGCYTEPELGLSYNIVADYVGSELPNEYVVIGGHIDSWTRGAQDDGGGFLTAWESINVLASLGLRPRRTIRVVGWTNEENGAAGAATYLQDNLNDINNTAFAIESDAGIFLPNGFSFSGTPDSLTTFEQVVDLLSPWYALNVTAGSVGVDITPLADAGVPAASLLVTGHDFAGKYWWYHHTQADCGSAVPQLDFNQVMSVFASVAYVIADMDARLEGV